MSSAILYLAIVAIWAVVLVPRWLRPSHTSGTLESNLAEPVSTSPQGDLADVEEDEEKEDSPAVSAQLPGADSERAQRDSGVPTGPRQEQEAGPVDPPGPGPAACERQVRMLQARRRTLITLIVLSAGAVAIAVTRVAASWVAIPPLAMLAGFVLVLREAARIDARRARASASRRGRQADARIEAGARTAAGDGQQDAELADHGQPGLASAEIIDISARVGDQLYDQYADAEVRAVGD